MLNLLGLGLSLLAKDDGMSKTVDDAKGSVLGLSAALDAIGDTAKGFDVVMKKGRTLTTEFEGQLMSMNKTGKALAYNAGLSAEEMKNVTKAATSMSLGIGVSMEEATNATIEYKRVQEDLNKIGIKNETEFAKALNVTGLSATEVREQLQLMSSVGIKSKAGVSGLTASFLEAGKQVGNVSLGFRTMNATLRELDEISVGKTGKRLSEEQMVKLGKGVASTAAMFKSLGYSAEEAMADASDMFREMTAQQTDFSKMFAGTVEDVPKGYEELSIITGDIRKSFDIMKQGPEGMVLGMKQLADAAKSKGLDMDRVLSFVGARMEGVFGKEKTTKMLKFMSNAGDETIKMAEKVTTATEGLGGAAAAFVDDRPLDQKMKMLEDMFHTRLRDINRTGDKFLKDSATSFKLLGNEIVALGKKDGPVGDLTRAFADFDQKGLIGLLPRDLQGTGAALGGFGKVVSDVLDKIRNPLSAVSSALVVFTTAVTDAFLKGPKEINVEGGGKRVLEFGERVQIAIEKVMDRFTNYLTTLPDTISKTVDSIFDSLIGAFGKGEKKGVVDWGKASDRFWNRIFGKDGAFTRLGPIFTKISNFTKALWGGFTKSFDPLTQTDNASQAGINVGLWLGSIWDKAKKWWDENIKPGIIEFGNNFFDGLDAGINPSTAKKKPEGLGGAVGEFLGSIWKIGEEMFMERVFPAILDFGSDIVDGLTSGLEPAQLGSAAPIGMRIGAHIASALETASKLVQQKLPRILSDIIKDTGRILLHSMNPFADDEGPKETLADDLPAAQSTKVTKLLIKAKPASDGVDLPGMAAAPNRANYVELQNTIDYPSYASEWLATTKAQHEEQMAANRALIQAVLTTQPSRSPTMAPPVERNGSSGGGRGSTYNNVDPVTGGVNR